MFSHGKTPTGKHPRPQPMQPLGAVYSCKEKDYKEILQESFSQSIIGK
jgi:hypothetical protein